MLIGKALGGPRAGVKLAAERNWDGIVMQPMRNNRAQKFYSGRYRWDSTLQIWKWNPDQ